MSKLMLRTCPTRLPGRIPKLPGDIQTRLATFLCVTSTPLGLPVVPNFENVSFQQLLADVMGEEERMELRSSESPREVPYQMCK
jgi:hypothetical protein